MDPPGWSIEVRGPRLLGYALGATAVVGLLLGLHALSTSVLPPEGDGGAFLAACLLLPGLLPAAAAAAA
ncbi:MAG TPA: hypothetical protein VG370_09700 [Chloroflexota bacterium]|nr:hypothetical protein [Chloroflexota bacterium]